MKNNEIKDKELEEISGGFIPPYPPSASVDKNGVMPVIFGSVMDKEEYVPSASEPDDNAGTVTTK